MKRITLELILVLWPFLFASGQTGALRQIDNGKFDKAEKELTKDLEKSPEDIAANYAMSSLLINRLFSGYDPQKSYQFLIKAIHNFENTTDEKEIKKLEKIPLNQDILRGFMDTIGRCSLEDAMRSDQVEDYRDYLSFYMQVPEKYRKTAGEKRDIAAFKVASATHSIDSYQKFINDYPAAVQVVEAVAKRNALAFDIVRGTDKIEHYKNFISTYPAAQEVGQARERIHELAFTDAQQLNTQGALEKFMIEYPQSQQYKTALNLLEKLQFTGSVKPGQWESYRDFIGNYPKNTLVPVAEDSLLTIAKRNGDWKIAEYCADNFTGTREKEAIRLLHDLLTRDGELQTLELFYDEYDDGLFQDIKSREYELAELGNQLDLSSSYKSSDYPFYDEYIRQAAPREKALVALQRMVSPLIMNKNWKAATETVKKYWSYFGSDNGNIKDLLSIMEKPADQSIRVETAGNGINTVSGGEYAPVISADDKFLYFCGVGRNDNIGGEDIFVSRRTGNSWSSSKIVTDLSSEYSNDAPECVSSDGTMMIFFIGGDLYYSTKTVDGWSDSEEFPSQINTSEWEADAVLSSDGKALLFASTREGGYNYITEYEYNYHGDPDVPSDIYVSILDEDDEEWSDPVNLGNVVNTPYCDRMPFLHPDMKTLYFSSDGHGGLGKLDVFKSVRLHDSCWNCWSEPVNMGKEINTADRDWGYKISTDGTRAYFAKSNPDNGKNDIYWLTVPNYLRPELVATITGKIVDSDEKPVSAEIRWEDLETGKNAGRSKSDPADGSYFIVLPMGKIYGYFVDEENYFPISNNLDLRRGNKPINVVENIELVTFRQMEEDETAVRINNLFFNFAESTLLPTSIPELKRVANIIRPRRIKVEISGHADNIGEDANNQILSERRAKAVRDFLVREGCNPSDLIAVGYGESRPVDTNETEAGRAKNRRVEMKFVK